MDRNEVLAALSRAEVDYVRVQSETKTVWEFQEAEWKAKALRAASEIIRAGMWIDWPNGHDDARGQYPPDEKEVLIYCGNWKSKDILVGCISKKSGTCGPSGATHWMPLPAPPAREVPLDPGPQNPIP